MVINRRQSISIKPVFTMVFTMICRLVPSDRILLELARMFAMWNKPLASKHLSHYLRGQGKTITVSTKRILDEDRGVLQEFFNGLIPQIGQGQSSGRVSISQLVYTNTDWLYALGGIQLYWTLKENHLSASFRNTYRWHPQESRITQKVHQAAEGLKSFGAREYLIVGTPVEIARETLTKTPIKENKSPKRCYLL